jgi:E3 ubiquitin-protein ligase ZSWIM2
MVRLSPWRSHCPPIVQAKLEAVAQSPGFLVVQQNGPTSFVLKDVVNEAQRKFKVRIGETQECSCSESKQDLCVHILFVMARVFRVPATNPVIWQKALLEAEIEQLVSGRLQANRQRAIPASVDGAGEDAQVQRKPIEAGDACPICCDDIIAGDGKALVYCRFGCGNNIHSSCFQQYAKHNATSPQPLQCPLCRSKWGALVHGAVLHGVSCSSCHIPICGERFRCAFCSVFNLCRKCFDDPSIHAQHPFDVSAQPGHGFQHVTRAAPVNRTGQAPVGIDPAHLELMTREIRPEDYERLLELDADVAPTAGSVLSEAEVLALPRVCWSQTNEQYEECSICLEAFLDGDSCIKLAPSCDHIFHAACALRWLTQSRAVCPIDNIPVVVQQRRPRPQLGPSGVPRASAGSAPHAPSDAGVNQRSAGGAAASRTRNPRRSLSQGHRFADVPTGRQTLNRVGNITEGSFRPTAEGLAGLVVGSTSIGPAVVVGRAPPGAGNRLPTLGLARIGVLRPAQHV